MSGMGFQCIYSAKFGCNFLFSEVLLLVFQSLFAIETKQNMLMLVKNVSDFLLWQWK